MGKHASSQGRLNVRRRERILDAGLALFLQQGYRGVRMEAVARAAGVAKPTLYRYFADKEALFCAGVERFLDEACALCEKGFSGRGGVADRVANALAAKNKLFYRLLDTSPFADELYLEAGRLAADAFSRFDRWLEARIAQVLDEAGHENAPMLSRLLIACAFGIGKKADQVEQIGPAIRLVTGKLLG